MANYVENVIINESDSTLTVHTTMQSDGTTGDLVNVPIVWASELTPPLDAGQYLSIYEVWYQLTNFTVLLSWAGLTYPDPCWSLTPSTDSFSDFRSFGGLIDDSGAYAQGGLIMTTSGFTSTTSYGTFVFRMRKHANTTPSYKNVGIPRGLPYNEMWGNSQSGTNN